MRNYWWKILGVIILLYVFTVGMLVPLKPGIDGVLPLSLKAGETVTLEISGYNTYFTRSQSEHRVWIKLDAEHTLQARRVDVVNDTHLKAVFTLPTALPTSDKRISASLLIDNDYDGAIVIPGTLSLSQEENNQVAQASAAWKASPIRQLNTKEGMHFPFRAILYETIRNTYFHVSLWLAMMILLIASVVFSVRYLRFTNPIDDHKAMAFTSSGLLFGIMGILTGMIWAKDTWGTYWTWEEVKMNMTAIALLIYMAYFVLRSSFDDFEKRARIASVYNIFAFASLIPLIYVVPRLADSLHPGNGGNPAFGSEDLDNTMRMVFYPAVIGWTLIGVWISSLIYRMKRIEDQLEED